MAIPRSLPTLAAARRLIAERLAPLEAEPVAAEAALGRTTAVAVLAVEALPPFDNSAMDGYAVRAGETPGTLRRAGESSAGHPAGRPLAAGEAMRISTGAMLPAGADAVARREVVEEGAGVEVLEAVAAGRDVRRTGEEVAAGAVLVGAGVRLSAVDLGALAAAGVAEVLCTRRPRVAVVVTGDELAGRAEPDPRRGVIRDSNRTMLTALAAAGGAEVVLTAAAPDDEAAIAAAVGAGLEVADLVVMSGGMSVGVHDHARAALAAAGVELAFAGVALAPGRPAAFGTDASGRAALGLPGNPLSALVAFRLLAEPALDALAGTRAPAGREVGVPAAAPLRRRDRRIHAVPCRLDADGAHPLPTGGHGPAAAVGAHGLALVPPGPGTLPAGELVVVALL
ncbi:MAG TPA: molybdopterin molybdotransferase MoeA [Solirubrobacteraceae bacterium]